MHTHRIGALTGGGDCPGGAILGTSSRGHFVSKVGAHEKTQSYGPKSLRKRDGALQKHTTSPGVADSPEAAK
jgi:hypothetical protein